MADFGYKTEDGNSWQSCENEISGSPATCPEKGEADSITAYVNVSDVQKRSKCALYKITETDGVFTYSYVGETEEKTLPESPPPPDLTGWVTYNFTEPKPQLEAGAQYLIVMWGESGDGYNHVWRKLNAGADLQRSDLETYNAFPESLEVSTANNQLILYCTYTPAAGGSGAVGGLGPSAMGAALGLAAFGSRGAGGGRPF